MDQTKCCPVCGTNGIFWRDTKDWEYKTSDDSYTYLQCPSCLTIYINEIPKDLSLIYPSNYYSFTKKSNSLLFRLKNWLDFQFYKPILKSLDAQTLSVLDVGGGTGEVADMLKKYDKRIAYSEIVDIDQEAQKIALDKGHVYNISTIEEFSTEKKFNLILLLNIIEHVADPEKLITKVGQMLSPDGFIIIKTPNADSLDARLFRNHYWGGLHCPRHWVIFSNTSFKKMMSRTNLVIKRIAFTQGAPFWTFSLIQFFGKKKIDPKSKSMVEQPLFTLIAIPFAIFDLIRSFFFKTSQMFIVISK
ncbi:MAG: class I SAM-dependent methyltransferase [Bacteroidetes bacterium]|nr:class I SAM-dependent methyltransferase [Bacteroidota bacterium]